MNGKGLNCRGWGSYPPPPPPLFLGGLKGSGDAHDCSSLSRRGSVANEGLRVSGPTTPPASPRPQHAARPFRSKPSGPSGLTGSPLLLVNK